MIFGEDDNDRKSLRYLVRALRPIPLTIKLLRKPIVLAKDCDPQKVKDRAERIAALVRAQAVRGPIAAVLDHRDADAIEPAHIASIQQMQKALIAAGVPIPIAVVPAFEMETWWWLWPDAVAAVNSKWKRLSRSGNVGVIADSKETLRRDLRARGARDYEESDSPRIAEKVSALGLVDCLAATSNSFACFEKAVRSSI